MLAHKHELMNVLLRSSPKRPAFKTLKLKDPGCTLPPRNTPMSFYLLRLATRGAMSSSNSSQDNLLTLPPKPPFLWLSSEPEQPSWLFSMHLAASLPEHYCVSDPFLCTSGIIAFQVGASTFTVPVLQMRELRQREVKHLFSGYLVGNFGLHRGSLVCGACAFHCGASLPQATSLGH